MVVFTKKKKENVYKLVVIQPHIQQVIYSMLKVNYMKLMANSSEALIIQRRVARNTIVFLWRGLTGVHSFLA